MRANLFNIKARWLELTDQGLIKEVGTHENPKYGCLERHYMIGEDLIMLRTFSKSHTEIRCECKFHCMKNATAPGSWCRNKSIFVEYLNNEYSQ